MRYRLTDHARQEIARHYISIDSDPPAVVTAYRTSKVSKYWRVES